MMRCAEKLKAESGVSLIEMVIVSIIISIGAMASYSALLMGQSHMRSGATVTEVQQEAVIAMKWIESRVKETDVNKIQIRVTKTKYLAGQNGGNALIFPSARDGGNRFCTDSDGRPIWQKLMVYYTDTASNSLCEYREPWLGSVAAHLPGLDLRAIAGSEPIARGLASAANGKVPVNFQWSAPGLLSITITTSAEVEAGADPYTELKTDIRLRN